MGGGPAPGPPGHPGPFPGPGPDMGREPRGPPPHEMRGPPDQWGKNYYNIFVIIVYTLWLNAYRQQWCSIWVIHTIYVIYMHSVMKYVPLVPRPFSSRKSKDEITDETLNPPSRSCDICMLNIFELLVTKCQQYIQI